MVWAIFFVCFWQNNNIAQIIVFLKNWRAYKNYQLSLICWLTGYWPLDAGLSCGMVDVSSTGWN